MREGAGVKTALKPSLDMQNIIKTIVRVWIFAVFSLIFGTRKLIITALDRVVSWQDFFI